MEEPSVDGALARLERAGEHIEQIEREMDRWIARKPYTMRADYDHGDTEVRVIVNVWDEPDFRRLAAIGGDAAFNLRSALDLLAWQLALRDGTPSKPEFPVFKDQARYFEVDGRGRPVRGSGLDKITEITDPEVRALIEWSQPFRQYPENPEADPLWALHQMCNEEKHQTLRPVIFKPVKGQTTITSKPPGIPLREVFVNRGPLEDEATLVIVEFTESPPGVTVDNEMTLGVGVKILGQFTGLAAALKHFRDRVREVVAEFKYLF